MAGSSLLALIEDIASILDDVSVMTKVAAKKTTGVLGDALALNAQQVAGVKAERELPVDVTIGTNPHAKVFQIDLVKRASRLTRYLEGLILFQNLKVQFLTVNPNSFDAHKMGALPVIADAKATLAALTRALAKDALSIRLHRANSRHPEEMDGGGGSALRGG